MNARTRNIMNNENMPLIRPPAPPVDAQFADYLEQLRTLSCSLYSQRKQLSKTELAKLGIQLQDLLVRTQVADPDPSLRQEYKISRGVINDLIAAGIDLEEHRRAAMVKELRLKKEAKAKREAARKIREQKENKAIAAAKAKKDKKPKSKKKKSRPWLIFSPMESNRRKH